MKKIRLAFPAVLLLSLSFSPLYAQQIRPTPASQRQAAIQHREQMRAHSIFKEYPVRSVGPVVMSGRVTDVAVDRDDPTHYYTAYASGGVFETRNGGGTMQPIFDYQGTLTIGDIAISRADSSVLWVGTGENNSSRSTYAGNGVYRSTDGGQSWTNTGLGGSQHIGRIVTSPTNPKTAWAASSGPLYSMNDVRGVYKTTDGGRTWQRTLTPPDSTGVIDLIIDPQNPKRLLAATWQRFRQAWNFDGDGQGSAIYISNDGGESWQKSMKGFPQGKFVGRIGLDVSRSNPDIVYAMLDNQTETHEKKKEKKGELQPHDFRTMSKTEFLNFDNAKLNDYLNRNGFPKKYDAKRVKNEVQKGVYQPKALADYLGDANSEEVSNSVKGAQVYRSNDGGRSWKKVNDYSLSSLVHTYGYYFGQIRVSPVNPDVVYTGGVPAIKSTNGGKTWHLIGNNQPVHSDNHAFWIDPHNPRHMLLGTDGGLYESRDGGKNFIHHNNAAVGQFYNVAVDMEKPYNIYGGLQDNGVFTGSSQDDPHDQTHWKRLFGGDGMHVVVNPKNSDLIYTGFQFGNYYRINQGNDKTTRITPQANIGNEKLRFNWNTPIALSPQNPDVLYMGSQFVHRSFDRGDHWQKISPDLTNEKASQQKGSVPYSTVTTISPSPLHFNVIWAGTDDGNVQVTRNGGERWKQVSGNLPQKRWVSHVEASLYDAGTAFVSLNGYRDDEFKTYIYKTTDFGQHWTSIKGNLPESVANTIIQDPNNADMLYAGLDAGAFASFNGGKRWFLLDGIPNVPAYDMVTQPRAMDLVVGTHGRSVYVANLKPMHTVAGKMNHPVIALKTESVAFSQNWGKQPVKYRPINEPTASWLYWLGDKNASDETVKITVQDSTGQTVKTLQDKGNYGFNAVEWHLKINDEPTYLSKGTYKITYKVNGHSDETTFDITGGNHDHRAGRGVRPERGEKGERKN